LARGIPPGEALGLGDLARPHDVLSRHLQSLSFSALGDQMSKRPSERIMRQRKPKWIPLTRWRADATLKEPHRLKQVLASRPDRTLRQRLGEVVPGAARRSAEVVGRKESHRCPEPLLGPTTISASRQLVACLPMFLCLPPCGRSLCPSLGLQHCLNGSHSAISVLSPQSSRAHVHLHP